MMLLTMIILPLAVIGFYKAYKNTKQVVVNKVELNKVGSSQNRPSLRVLHLSDLHIENLSISATEIYERFKNEKFDLIALTGDFLDRKRSIPKLVPYLEALNKLNPQFGIYAVFGNHDYVLRKQHFVKLKDTLINNGVKVMQNEHEAITVEGERVNIIGIDDFSTKRSDLAKSYTGITEGYNLVLTHDPNIVLHMKEYHYDYLLSGHFHGGQIHWPKPYHLVKMGKLVRLNMVKGLHQYQGKRFYISEGLGQTGVNIRVGSRPEVTLHQVSI